MTSRSFTHNATFVGLNGSMGLVHGKTYTVRGYVSNGYLWVEWVVGKNPFTGRAKTRSCPYASVEKVRKNWALPSDVPVTSENMFQFTLLGAIEVMLR